MSSPQFRDYVIDDWLAWKGEGADCLLATLVHIEGSGPRPAGSQMAIAVDGRGPRDMVGYLSGGCVEGAIAEQGLAALQSRRFQVVDFGEGSRYWDINLPCGSRIHVVIDPLLPLDVAQAIAEARRERRFVTLETDLAEGRHALLEGGDDLGLRDRSSVVSRWDADGRIAAFRKAYAPSVKLILVGSGPVAESLAGFALGLGYDVVALPGHGSWTGPENGLRIIPGDEARALAKAGMDQRTALVTLFHDHDRELEPLQAALASDAFYVGALGSARSQAARRALLSGRGFGDKDLDRIDGPAGLPIGAASPPEIALAILAAVVRADRSGA
ncbi:MAG: XdhC family protein [Rhodospirillales bacterium]